MKNPLISIIVPVYNVEPYLERCLDSILSQTYKNYEVILIDDGSTDNSGKICDTYAKNHPQIKVFHKKNGGLSDARNFGIKKSSGEYLTFVDSDDTITEDALEYLYSLIKKHHTKMAIAPYTIITKKRKTNLGKNFSPAVLNTEEALRRMLTEHGFTVSACAKLYHKNLFANVEYPTGKFYEDNATTYKLILKCPKIAYGNHSIYNYIVHPEKSTITSQKFTIQKLDYISLTEQACPDILQNFPNLKNECEARCVTAKLSILRQLLNTTALTNPEAQTAQQNLVKYFRTNYHNLIRNPSLSRKSVLSLSALKANKHLLKIGANLYEKYK